MFIPAVNQRSHWAAVNEIQSPAGQWKTLSSEILHVWSEVQLSAEPRFYSVLVGRSDIGQVISHKRANVRGDHLVRNAFTRRTTAQEQNQGERRDGGCAEGIPS